MAIGRPPVHLVMPSGLGSGTPVIQHGRHGEADGNGTAMVVECGQHFLRSASDLATQVARDFLAHFGLVDADPGRPAPGPQRRFELLETHVIKTPEFRFARPVVGFEVFRKGELVYTDGALEVRAPVDDCTIFMPSREVTVGKEAVYLTRPMQ
jgi:hypothetical protein